MEKIVRLGLLLALIGVVAAHDPALDELHMSPFAALDKVQEGNATGGDWRKHCKITCQGPGNGPVEELEGGKRCIGTFRVFCKIDVHGHKAMVGTKCEGSFGGFESKEHGKVFIKCDGKMVHWGVMDVPKPPHGDDNPHGDDPDASFPPPKRPPFPPPPKGPMKLISVHGCVGTQAVMMTRPEHADGLSMLTSDADAEWMWAKVETQDVVNGNFTPVAEGRCDGTSFVVKKARPAHRPHEDEAASPADDLDAMLADAEAAVDEEVHAVEHPGWLPSWAFPQLAPPELFAKEPCEDAPDGGFPHAPPHGPPHKMPGHCRLRCNHRPTFMHGAMPCFGVFEADCHFHKPPHAPHKHNETHAMLLSGRRALRHWHHAGTHNGSHEHCPHHHEGGAHLVARCEGMFTGRFMGTKCRGFSFGTVSTPRMQLVGTCSKGQFMHAGPMRGGFGMVSVCTDKAMMVVMRGDNDEGEAEVQVA